MLAYILTPALTFCDITSKAMKPVALPYPDTLTTLGDHLRTSRIDLGLYQKDVARRLGVTTDSVAYWENNRNQPSLRMIPRITDFLGYSPNLEAEPDETLGERIVRVRRALGIRQKDLARQLGVDPSTLAKQEHRSREPGSRHKTLLERVLELSAHRVISAIGNEARGWGASVR